LPSCPFPSRGTALGLCLLSILPPLPHRLAGTQFVFEALTDLAEVGQWLQELSEEPDIAITYT